LGGTTFFKPADNIGNKSIADYAGYAGHFVYEVNIPGCPSPGKVFVVNARKVSSSISARYSIWSNTNPAGPRDGEPNTLSDKNVTSIALEVRRPA